MELITAYIQQGLSFIIPLIILLGLLIFVHELGHFLVAKYYGVRVEVFSLGFGKKLFKYKKGDTEYCLSLIPFGGYVKMFGDELTSEVSAEEKKFAFNHKPVGQRIAVVLAGPLMNFFFAIVLFAAIAFIGEDTIMPMVGDVPNSSAAYSSGFRSGDKILEINSQPVQTWENVQTLVESNPDKELVFKVERFANQEALELRATPKLAPNKNILSSQEYVGEIEGLSFTSTASTVGISSTSSAAYKAGLRTGDQIIEVNGSPVQRFKELVSAINNATTEKVTFKVKPQDEKAEEYTAELARGTLMAEEFLLTNGIEKSDLYVSKVVEKSPAEKSGLVAGDRLTQIKGTPVSAWQDVVTLVQSYQEGQGPLPVVVKRDGQLVDLQITPEITTQTLATGKEKQVYALGVVTAMIMAPPFTFIERTSNPFSAIKNGIEKSIYWTKATIMSFVRLIQNKVSAKSIGGPIMIGQLASKTFEIGISPFLKIMAIISINLFVLNLLPIPILDGGHLVFYTIEAIKGAPLSMRKMEIAQQVGLFLLMGLMIFALINDVSRLFQ